MRIPFVGTLVVRLDDLHYTQQDTIQLVKDCLWLKVDKALAAYVNDPHGDCPSHQACCAIRLDHDKIKQLMRASHMTHQDLPSMAVDLAWVECNADMAMGSCGVPGSLFQVGTQLLADYGFAEADKYNFTVSK
jgi:hypothetical protein